MNLHSRFAGLFCGLLASAQVFAGADELGLSYRLNFGAAAQPARMALALRTSAPELDLGIPAASTALPLEAPLWSARLHQWRLSDTHLLGIPYGAKLSDARLDADGNGGVSAWLWGGVAVVGALVLVGLAAGGAGGGNDDGTVNGVSNSDNGSCNVVGVDPQNPANSDVAGPNCPSPVPGGG
jgi:hypothetical protein